MVAAHTPAPMRSHGTIRLVDAALRYGLIDTARGVAAFRFTHVASADVPALAAGAAVTFQSEHGPRGIQAVDLRVAAAPARDTVDPAAVTVAGGRSAQL